MSKFKIGDKVRLVNVCPTAVKPNGSEGVVVDAGIIVQFPTEEEQTTCDCDSAECLGCEWFFADTEELELISPQNPLDIPGYTPPAGWRIKDDDEFVVKGDAYSHNGGGDVWDAPSECGVLGNSVCLSRTKYMENGGYILTPVVMPPEPKEAWYIHAEDGLAEKCQAFYQTEEDALDTLKDCSDMTILYRCVPVARKTSQITMLGDTE